MVSCKSKVQITTKEKWFNGYGTFEYDRCLRMSAQRVGLRNPNRSET